MFQDFMHFTKNTIFMFSKISCNIFGLNENFYFINSFIFSQIVSAFCLKLICDKSSFSRVLIRKSDNVRNECKLSDSGNNEDQPLQLNEISSSESERLHKRKEQQETSSCDKRKHTSSSFVSSSSYNFRLKQKLRLIHFGIVFALLLNPRNR